jgi:hypothetical protein
MPAPSDTTFRTPLAESDLRAAKNDAATALVEQARAFGAEPNGRAIEAFVAPILEKVNRDHEDLLRRGIDPNAPKRAVGPRDREDVSVETTELGTYDANTDTFKPNEAGEAAIAKRVAARPLTLEGKALALVCRKTKYDPDFETLRRAWLTMQLREMPPEARRGARLLILERLLQDYSRKYGDPRLEVQRLEAGEAARG